MAVRRAKPTRASSGETRRSQPSPGAMSPNPRVATVTSDRYTESSSAGSCAVSDPAAKVKAPGIWGQ
ncbi:hypothetical protein GCM10017771_78600 [Streptomyces capitiformicae]|uniref:Uncharacterized protein n=1 Tax=Streptomyces capitiformicae TaxID=2014920 RepID=A0A918ZK79_9ACTN|nr:hypothetical protein GCM10017771_78600 [Streptomyces capitiformicae]